MMVTVEGALPGVDAVVLEEAGAGQEGHLRGVRLYEEGGVVVASQQEGVVLVPEAVVCPGLGHQEVEQLVKEEVEEGKTFQ